VINKTSYVSPALRAKVERAIADLKYSPNLLARSVALRKSNTLGILIPDISNPFFPEIVRGVENKAKEAGYSLILGNSDNELTEEELYLNVFLSKRVDGILLVKAPGELNKNLLETLRVAGPPVVLVDREYPSMRADTVVADDVGGAYAATQHLLDLGHRCIGIVVGLADASTTKGRMLGYCQALASRGISFDPLLVGQGDYRVDSGYKAGMCLMDQKPSAVLITNCMMTLGFLRAIEERNLRCPEDVAIVSYDDLIWNEFFNPTLTCVVQPKYRLGTRGAEILISRIRGEHKRPKLEVLKNEFRVRESSGELLGQKLRSAHSTSTHTAQ
jgi:LacI family transcriptional regulator